MSLHSHPDIQDVYMKSILQTEKECFITHCTTGLDKHHIFGGALRNWSEKNGLWVWLRHDIHMSYHQKHPEELKRLKRIAQAEYEKTHTREEFMNHVRKNYI